MPRAMEITGVVLAGGRATRMQGADKGLVTFRGEPLAGRSLRFLREQGCREVIVNANRHQEIYARWGVPVVADSVAGFCGPLAGIAAAMRAAKTPWILVVPCDVPLLPGDLAARLAAEVREGTEVVCARVAGRLQPLCALLRTELAGAIEQALSEGERRAGMWLSGRLLRTADWEDATAFANFNTREDLELLENQGTVPASALQS